MPPRAARQIWQGAATTEPTKPAWTPEEDATVLRMRNGRGHLWTRIGAAVGRDPADCRARWDYLTYVRMHGHGPRVGARLRCLKCREWFDSPDKARVRKCDACKRAEAQEGGLSENMLDAGDGGGVVADLDDTEPFPEAENAGP